MPSFKKSLELKIIVSLTLILAIILTGSTLFSTWLNSRDTYQIVFQQLDSLANTIQKSLINDMGEGRSNQVQRILEIVGTENGIKGVRIFGPDGEILKSYQRGEIGHPVEAGAFENFKQSKGSFITEKDGQRTLHILHPIANSPPCFRCHGKDQEIIGVLALDFSLGSADASIREHNYKTLFVLFFSVTVLGLLVYVFIKKNISNPVKTMKAAMAEAEKGNLDVKIAVHSEDEIGSLQESFNSMLVKVKELNKENLVQQQDLIRKEEELKLQEALSEQNRALEAANSETLEKNRYYMEMLSFITHELKGPLVIFKGYSDLLVNGDLGELNEPQRDALLAMDKNIDSISEMIADYLGLSRIERGELKPEKAVFDLSAELVEPVIKNYSEALVKSSMRVKVDHPDGEPIRVVADRGLMESVFGNLLSNAIKYGKAESEIMVKMELDNAQVRVSVVNEGDGIPGRDLERIFERFTRLDNEVTMRNKGSGLGLCIVKEIVERHGGSVWAESVAGSSVSFVFTLPQGGTVNA